MSILEKLNKVIMEKDCAAAAEIIHDDYKRYSHLQRNYTESGKAGMIEAINKGFMKVDKYRILYENDEIGVHHSFVTFKDGNTQAVMAVYKFKDGKIFSLETGATNMPK